VPLAWPLPAFIAWALGWATFAGLRALSMPPSIALALGVLVGGLVATTGATPWRRAFMGAGFPLSFIASGSAGSLPPWAWLAALAALALIYPVGAWRDAPLFPTPHGALAGLGRVLALRDDATIVDAGCGLGDALLELRREYPRARLIGLERSWLLRALCAARCRFARIRRADMWATDWSACDLVYLFQRPESMQRAADKAAREMRPATWLASLEFEIETLRPARAFTCADGRPLWLYRLPFDARDPVVGSRAA
jgi:SAM-dependent methyltransferase